MRQHETVGQTVGHTEVGAKGVGQGVNLGYMVDIQRNTEY